MSPILEALEVGQAGNWGEAEARLVTYLKEHSDDVEGYNALAFASARLGKKREAVSYATKAMELMPDQPLLLNNLSRILNHFKSFAEAETAARLSVKLDSQQTEGFDLLGTALLNLSKPTEALECFEKSRALTSGQPDEVYRHATALLLLGRLEEAEKEFRETIRLNPQYVEGYTNLGVTLRNMGRYAEALECYEKALAWRPDYIEAHLNRGTALLTLGEWSCAWDEFEWRFRAVPNLIRESFAQPVWEGESFKGKTLFLHAEQGLGDTIQLTRYFPLIKERGGNVVLEVQRPLVSWFAGHPGLDEVIYIGQEKPAFDLHIALFSLPRIFKTTPETVPSLIVPPACHTAEAKKHSSPRVGLVWAGNPGHTDDAARSCPEKEIAVLLEVEGVEWISLQKDIVLFQQLKELSQREIKEGVLSCTDFLDTARVIQSLDLVITVDTAVAHLAATMGKQVWILLAVPSDWRWLLNRSDTVWYPTVRLFRQTQPRGWKELLEKVKVALAVWINADK